METATSGTGNDASSAQNTGSSGNGKQQLALMALIALAAVVAYSPILFNWFAGDDFVHLSWLKDAVTNPELIWRNFHSSWLDGTTTKFYRPLISLFMLSDYMLGGANGLIFHITNLLFLIAAALLLYKIVARLQQLALAKENLIWPFAAASLFALYPLHPEAVSWITGRVDAIVAVFYLASLWFYMRWRQKQSLFLWSVLFFICALTSKEMAVTIPAMLVVYELCFGAGTEEKRGWGGYVSALSKTAIFWLLLIAYFVVRLLSLGTLVGGYDDSLTFIADWSHFIQAWVHGLRMLFVPINRTIMGDHNFFTIAWMVGMSLMTALSVANLFLNNRLVRVALFFVMFTGAAFAPVYKLFTIDDDLQSSRLAYLATAPICALLSLAFYPFENMKFRLLQRVLLGLVLTLAGGLLIMNNQPWAQAGRETNAIRAGLLKLYATIPDDPQVMLVGLPDQIDGAFVCRNALSAMTEFPLFPRTISNCLMVNRFEPILPFGFLKNSIAAHRDKIIIAMWQHDSKSFTRVAIPNLRELAAARTTAWSGKQLLDITYGERGTKLKTQSDGSILVTNDNPRSRPELSIKPGAIPCFNTDFIQLDLAPSYIPHLSKHAGVDISLANSLSPNYDIGAKIHADLQLVDANQKLIFQARGLPGWALGGTTTQYLFYFPEGSQLKVRALHLVAPEELMPSINFRNSDYLGTKGFVHLGSDVESEKISYDASHVPGAVGVEFDITRPNLPFLEQNSTHKESMTMKTLPASGKTGQLELNRTLFPSVGIYGVRAVAVDKEGKRLGVAGDHIIISVDN